MFPLRDDIPSTRAPVVTTLLIVVNVAVWLAQIAYGVTASVLDYGLIPSFLLHGVRDGQIMLPELGIAHLHQEVGVPYTVLTSMFLHGSWMHVIGNMWFLWIFGDNVEDALGHLRYLGFYLLSGLAAAAAQVLASPGSAAPMVGASGAIAGVLGAYLVLYPHARVRTLLVLVIFITIVNLPAWLLLGVWFISQFFVPMQAGVAWMAHVGGFGFGAIAAALLRRRLLQ